ncbi:MAG: hypothetical protein R3D28_15890 [Geminicoccaceae bacterium]
MRGSSKNDQTTLTGAPKAWSAARLRAFCPASGMAWIEAKGT